jgi:hypothetical protein
MSKFKKYICSKCGQEHEDWPALAFSSPSHYNDLSDDEKSSIAELSSDFCVIKYSDQIDRFIRCTMDIRIIDHCETLQYGIWVTLSEKSFENYKTNFHNEEHEESYFGWLSNQLVGYKNTTKIPTSVFTRSGNNRPEVVPHEDFDHPLVTDYYNGISKAEAERRIKEMLDMCR